MKWSYRGFLSAALVLAVGVGATGCRNAFSKGIRHYRSGAFSQALGQLKRYEPYLPRLGPQKKVRYMAYRGLTHYRLEQKDEAKKWLLEADTAYRAGSKTWLQPTIATQLRQAVASVGGAPKAPSPKTPAPTPRPPKPPKPAVAPPGTATAVIKPGTVVAVFDVEDASNKLDAATLGQLTEYFAGQLTGIARLKVVPRAQLRKRLVMERKKSYKKCYDSSCQIALGRAVAAQKSIATKLLRVGNRCAITSALFDLRTETTTGAATVDTQCGTNALMDGVKEIARRFAGLPPRRPGPPAKKH